MPTWCYKYTPCFCGILLETGTSALELFGDSCMRVLYPIEGSLTQGVYQRAQVRTHGLKSSTNLPLL